MGQAKFIRIDHNQTVEKEFTSSTPFESLKPNEVIDVDCEDGVTREYYVESMAWDFSHFGDTLVIIIKPCNPPPKVETIIDPMTGNVIGIIKS